MKDNSVINKIKVLLGMEVSLEQVTLENGTVIEAEVFEAGQAVFIVTEDGQVPLPVGEYTMPDGMMLVVSEDGIIGEIKEAEMPAEEEAPAAEVEVEVEASVEEAPEFVTKKDFEDAMNEIKAMFSALQPKEETKVEMSAAEMPAAKAIKPNPEKEQVNKIEFKIAPKSKTIESSVMAKISQIKK